MTITAQLAEPTDLDRFVYLPRNDGGTNGIIMAIKVEVSLDGTNWQEVGSASNWAKDSSTKEIKFAPGIKAAWIRFIIPTGGSVNEFVSGTEFLIYKKA